MRKNTVPVEIRGQRNHIKYLDPLRDISRSNRQKMTRSEIRIWLELLKNKQLGFRFLRQKPLGQFVADFYCASLALIIEIDGSSHNQKIYTDFNRDRYFEIRGIKTIRIKNDNVIHNLEQVKKELVETIKTRKTELRI